jgi:hypothetical protein
MEIRDESHCFPFLEEFPLTLFPDRIQYDPHLKVQQCYESKDVVANREVQGREED